MVGYENRIRISHPPVVGELSYEIGGRDLVVATSGSASHQTPSLQASIKALLGDPLCAVFGLDRVKNLPNYRGKGS
jgi:hypothetical protein